MQENQKVADMAIDVLAHQAGIRSGRTGEPFEEELKAVLETEAGRQLGELRGGPHRDEKANQWRLDMAQKRARERKREQTEERKRAERTDGWKRFVQAELRELEKRKGG